jgi:flagellar FliL protein
MADEETKQEETKEEKAEKKKLSIFNNKLFLVGIIILAQLGIAFLLGTMLSGRSAGDKEQVKAEEVEWEGSGERGKIVMLENIVLNLSENDRLYYLKITMGLEVSTPDMEKEVKKREAHLRDIVISCISGKGVTELDNEEERNSLKTELYRKLNKALTTGDLIQIYFSDFVIQ